MPRPPRLGGFGGGGLKMAVSLSASGGGGW
jgi:hypothetical protein